MNGVNHLSNQPDVLSHQELADIAEKTLLTIKKVQRTNEKIQTELGRRSINTIINSGETCYM